MLAFSRKREREKSECSTAGVRTTTPVRAPAFLVRVGYSSDRTSGRDGVA